MLRALKNMTSFTANVSSFVHAKCLFTHAEKIPVTVSPPRCFAKARGPVAGMEDMEVDYELEPEFGSSHGVSDEGTEAPMSSLLNDEPAVPSSSGVRRPRGPRAGKKLSKKMREARGTKQLVEAAGVGAAAASLPGGHDGSGCFRDALSSGSGSLASCASQRMSDAEGRVSGLADAAAGVAGVAAAFPGGHDGSGRPREALSSGSGSFASCAGHRSSGDQDGSGHSHSAFPLSLSSLPSRRTHST